MYRSNFDLSKPHVLTFILQLLLFLLLFAVPFHSVLIFPGVSVVKAIGLAIIPLYLIWIAGKIRSTRGILKVGRRNVRLILSFATLIASILLSTFYEPINPIFSTSLITIVSFIGMAMVMCTLLFSEILIRRAYMSLVVGGIVFSLLVILQFGMPHLINQIFGNRIFFGKVQGTFVVRATGVFRDPNYAALMLIVILCLSFYVVLTCRKKWELIFLLFGIAIQMVAVLLTFSRAGYITLIIIGSAVLWRERYRVSYWRVALCAMMFLILLPSVGDRIFDLAVARTATLAKFMELLRGNPQVASQFDLSLWYRFQVLQAGIKMILDKFPFGVGWENFTYQVIQYSDEIPSYGSGPHNTYIAVAAELGLPGFIALVMLLWTLWFSTNRLSKIEHDRIGFLAKGARYGLLAILIGGISLTLLYEAIVWALIGLIMAENQVVIKEVNVKHGEFKRDGTKRIA